MKLFENNTESSSAQVTFIIGNGFDLGLGMKTSYEDIYREYVKSPSDTDVIKNFKSELLQRKPYDKWSDFEMGMVEYAKALSSENELIECVRDFKSFMVNHLRNENDRIAKVIQESSNKAYLIKELDRSFDMFYSGFSPNVIEEIKQLLGDDFVEHKVITFNYTNTIEMLFNLKFRLQKIIENPPLHIHGSLDRDVVLGIDNIRQLKDVSYKLSRRGERAFVKPLFNDLYDKARVIAAKNFISESSVICVYGFSLGESDKIWVDCLVEWLRYDSSHHLVIFQYDETKYEYHNFDILMDVEELKKDKLMERLGITEAEIYNQIHIPVGYDIFNFDFVKIIPNTLPV